MKKYRYMLAVACVLAGAAGFAGIFAMEQLDSDKKELTKNEQIEQIQQMDSQIDSIEELGNQNIAGTDLVAQKDDSTSENTQTQQNVIPVEDTKQEEIAKNPVNKTQEQQQVQEQPENTVKETPEKVAPVETIAEEKLHFEAEKGIIWPSEGSILLDYSMDSSIYFPTLQQ